MFYFHAQKNKRNYLPIDVPPIGCEVHLENEDDVGTVQEVHGHDLRVAWSIGNSDSEW